MQICTQANTSAHKTELLKDREKSLRWHHGKTRNEHGTFHGDYSWEAWVKSFRDAECVWQGQELQSLLYRPPLDFYNMWYLKKTFMTDFFLFSKTSFLYCRYTIAAHKTTPHHETHLQAPCALSKEQRFASSFLKHYLFNAKVPESWTPWPPRGHSGHFTSLPWGRQLFQRNFFPWRWPSFYTCCSQRKRIVHLCLSPVPLAQAEPTIRSITYVRCSLCDSKHKPKSGTGWETWLSG